MIEKIESFKTDTIHGMRISYCSETQVMTIMYRDVWTVKLTVLNEHTKKVIYTIHSLLFEVIQVGRTISEHEKKIEDLTAEKNNLKKQLAESEEDNRKLRNELERERQWTKPVLSEWAEEIAKTNHIKLTRLETRFNRLLNQFEKTKKGQ